MKNTNKVDAAFTRALETYALPEGCKGILAGYSGGADSTALLTLLMRFCDVNGLDLLAVHVHHGIRGEEADRDAEHCARFCARRGIPFVLEKIDVPALAKQEGRGLEETARRHRYAAFARIAAENGLSCIATAHNADDNAETMLFNLARGAGLNGLAGIPPVRVTDGLTIIRPLLACTKAEILAYCEELQLPYVTDSTNADTAYTRNYIRHELLPALERINPAFLSAMGRTSAALREDAAYLNEQADAFLAEHCTNGRLPLTALTNAPHPIAVRALRRMFADISPAALETVHLEAVLRLAQTGREGASISLSDRVRAVVECGKLFFTREVKTEEPFRHPLKIGINRFDSPDFALLIGQNGKNFEKDNEFLQNIYKLSMNIRLDSDKINNVLFVRSRMDGDAYVYGGMTRRLKKLYNDRGIPPARRRTLPVVCDDGGIVWVPGFPAADRVRPAGSADDVLNMIYYYNEVL
ncbi:MAG: tRNA lysidine(34) synthetase TilS [Clostridia bacterium]|nr:tRNA lysidine(34) synthetase TilS [Clostridia bacterium]